MSETQKAPEEQEAQNEGRRIALAMTAKVLGAVGLAYLADKISGGRVLGPIFGQETADEHGETSEDHLKGASDDLSAKLDAKADEIAAKVEAESKDLFEAEKAMKVVNYVGCVLFGWGIKDLLPGGHGHIHAAHYGALASLTLIKHQLSDEEGKHHLVEETKSNANAFLIISGTIVAAEGMNADIEKAYELEKGKKPDKRDQVALMNMLASVLSLGATTVGSASILRKMSNELCDGDPAMMAVCTSHISNLSGFLLFGDPPFIAICEKYGFAEGVSWQFKTMLPLAIYSLLSSTYKLNLLLARKEGLGLKEAAEKAWTDTISGIKNNVGVLVKIMAKSLFNAAKYFTGADLSKSFTQDQGGIEWKIGEVLMQKLGNLSKLPFSPEFDQTSHEAHEGMVREDGTERAVHEMMAGLMVKLGEGDGHEAKSPESRQAALRKAIDERDYVTITELGREMGIPQIEVFAATLHDFHDNREVDESTSEASHENWRQKLHPANLYNRTFSIHRIKEALGHNLGDVINVFPFQASCVPFLTPAFEELADSLSGLGETAKEAIIFALIMLFSSMADNYVACKVGLELMPDKPHIPLIAAIQGGSLTAIGNMANVAQFSLDAFPLMDSMKQAGLHIDPALASFAWSKAIDIFTGIGWYEKLKPIKGAGSVADTSHEVKDKVADATSSRGDFLGLSKLPWRKAA